MLRIPGAIDKYIMDGKIAFSLNKSNKVMPVYLDKLLANGQDKAPYSNKEEDIMEPFDDVLQDEIKKISSK